MPTLYHVVAFFIILSRRGCKCGVPAALSSSEQLPVIVDGPTTEKSMGALPLCDRCGEEIALANDLDQAGDIDRKRHLVLVAGKPRRLTPIFWRLFTLLYARRGDVVDNDRLFAEVYRDQEQRMAPNAVRDNVWRLRKVLAGRGSRSTTRLLK
jgi:hypothetical protein